MTAAPRPGEYPAAERDDVVDILHGVEVSDPYRYLEDPDSDRTRSFVAAQNAVSAPYLADLPTREWFLETVTALLCRPRFGVPWERGGRYFRTQNPGDLDQDLLVVADRPDPRDPAEYRVLLDPNTLAGDGTIALADASVSPDGALLAAALAEAGSDWRTIVVRDVDSGADLPDRLTWTKWVAPTWMPDGSGFLYWRYPEPTGGEFTDAMGAGELVLHRLGTDQADDVLVWSRPADRDWMAAPYVAANGRWLVLVLAPGTDSRATVEARRIVLDDVGRCVPDDTVVTVVGELTHAQGYVGVVDDTLYLRTEDGAERGRLVGVDLVEPTQPWADVVAEHPTDVLADAVPTAAGFVLVWSRDAAHRVEVVDRDGVYSGDVPLPVPSAVVGLNARVATDEVFLGYTSFTAPLIVDQLVVIETDVEVRRLADLGGDRAAEPTGVAITGSTIAGERRRGTSADGTAVPMTVISRADLPEGPRPTLLYGYGGFDIPVLPSFSALFTAWVRAGGVLAVANLRGGGEYGSAWHEAGMKLHKQRVFDDLYACAEALFADGTTTPEQLAVHGRSNGGLLVGAAITQRPELFAAALPTVGVLDMLRFHLFTIGWAWTTEYGTADDPDEFAALLAYSPLHQLRPGTAYPPTLISTGDHDDRVVPAHSLKFGAELQRCQAGSGPVLLRVDTRAGHGMGKPVTSLAAEYAEQLAFAAAHTGLDPTGTVDNG